MKKQSAGLLLHRQKNNAVEVLLVHPGGPFWAKKDAGAWSIPKGEFQEGEEPFTAAKREFSEELGLTAPEGKSQELTPIKQPSGKIVYIWAIQADLDTSAIKSNTFNMEWPPRSGKQQEFPEVNKASWLDLGTASQKIVKGQTGFLDQLATLLRTTIVDNPAPDSEPPQQASLF